MSCQAFSFKYNNADKYSDIVLLMFTDFNFLLFRKSVSRHKTKNVSTSPLVNIYNVISSKNNWTIEIFLPKVLCLIKRNFFNMSINASFLPNSTKLGNCLKTKPLRSANVKTGVPKMKQKNKKKRLKANAASLTYGRISVLRSREPTEHSSLEKYRDTVSDNTSNIYKKRINLTSRPACLCYLQYNATKTGKDGIICFSFITFYLLMSRHL